MKNKEPIGEVFSSRATCCTVTRRNYSSVITDDFKLIVSRLNLSDSNNKYKPSVISAYFKSVVLKLWVMDKKEHSHVRPSTVY